MTITLQDFSVSTKSEESKKLLSDINFSFEVAKSYLITGKSGNGKTLLARSVAGLLSFHLKTNGYRILTGISESEILYAPQFANLFFDENASIEFTKNLFKSNSILESNEYEKRFLFYLKKTGLLELSSNLKIPVSTLSMGMKYRLMLIFLFLQKPKFLIIDEPTASLDVLTSKQIIQLLFDYKTETNCGLMVVSHEIQYFNGYLVELLKMENGYLVGKQKLSVSSRILNNKCE